jgi:hypothetical protein
MYQLTGLRLAFEARSPKDRDFGTRGEKTQKDHDEDDIKLERAHGIRVRDGPPSKLSTR